MTSHAFHSAIQRNALALVKEEEQTEPLWAGKGLSHITEEHVEQELLCSPLEADCHILAAALIFLLSSLFRPH